MIEAHLDGRIALEDLAAMCGLSASRFAHAFKSSVRVAPYQWLLQRRIERSKMLLQHSAHGLADIAQSCGFADQSHFTRVFRRAVGASPGTWKRSLRYLVATADKMIPPDAQRCMAKRADSTVAEEKGSHAIYVSKLEVVATLIEQAAKR